MKIKEEVKEIFLIVFFSFLLLFSFLSSYSLFNPDEPRDAEIAREMCSSKNFIVPTFNNQPFLEKPPFFYWSICISSFIFHRFNEMTVRLPTAFFGALGLVVVFFFGKFIYDRKTAFLASLLLLSFFEYWHLSRRVILDIPFSFIITISLFYFYLFTIKEKKIFLYLFYLFISLSILTKGFLGLIIPGGTIFFYLLLTKNFKLLTKIKIHLGFLIVFIFVFPWIYLLYKQGGENFLKIFFIDNHLKRFFSSYGGHSQPFYYYFYTVILDFLPFSLFLPQVILFYRKNIKDKNSFFLLVWFLSGLLILSLSTTKRETYLLPLYAPFSLLFANFFNKNNFHQDKFNKITTKISLYAGGFILTLFSGAIIFLKFSYLKSGLTFQTFFVSLTFLFLITYLFKNIIKFEVNKAVRIKIAFLLFIYFITPFFILKDSEKFFSVKPFAYSFLKKVKEKDKIFIYRIPEGMVGSYLFYTRKTIPEITKESINEVIKKNKVFILTEEKHLGDLKNFNLYSVIVFKLKWGRNSVLLSNQKDSLTIIENGKVVKN
jgi:4-amino-4-deoxy-L-arabinose transferase-like glycosyltransferase